MLKPIKKLSLLFILTVLISGLNACKKSDPKTDDNTEAGPYSLRVSAGTPSSEYILRTASLTSGTLSPVGNGVTTKITTMTTKNGFYYGIDNDTGNLVKYTSDNKVNTIIKQIPFTQISWAFYSSFYKWKDDKTLVLFSSNGSIQFEYAILNVETMTITSYGNINVPKPLKDHYFWGYSATFVDNKFYLSYTQNTDAGDLPVDTTYMAAMDYPAMNNIIVTKDTRFTMPGHYTLHMPSSFSDNGLAYFQASPTIWTTSAPNKPFGIYRVNKGATQIDPSYFFELTDKTKEEAMGLFHIANGKAIVKILDRAKITSSDSYNDAFITDYYVVDVNTQTKVKINIPKSISGGYSENVLVDNGQVYIAAQTAEGFYIYQYNPGTSAVTKGLKIEGVTGLSRLERIK